MKAEKPAKPEIESIDGYISMFPKKTRDILSGLRKAIHGAAPEAVEKISYQIPTFWLNGNLVHFAAYEKHIGFYPGAAGISGFSKEISRYKNAKGSVQFPIEEPLPMDLILKIVKFRVKQNTEKGKKPKPGKKA